VTVLEAVRAGWTWCGLDAAEVVATNPFGNVIVRAADGAYWRICPEELECKPIAGAAQALATLRGDPAFSADWEMGALASQAAQELGDPGPGRCFCLKMPGVLGGAYSMSNVGVITVVEHLEFTGSLAQQTHDLTDGTRVQFEIDD
jgi:hypothetical protein